MMRLFIVALSLILVTSQASALSFPKPSGDPALWSLDETVDYCFWGAGATIAVKSPNGVTRYERGDLDCYTAMDVNNVPEVGGDNDEGDE